ncbi:MAG: efflux RND transporter periplasmic adaptor subunit [Thermodesulfobacteriota bacterium]
MAGLKPRLRSHVEIHRHQYRGEVWYVLQDHATGRFQRFNTAAYLLIGIMDGERTVQEIWEEVRARLGEEAPTQDEMIRLLSQLYAVDVLQCNVPPDTEELMRRFEKRRWVQWKQNLWNPLFMRFSLLDPERFLIRWLAFVRPLFSRFGAILWLAVVGAGVVLAGLHWVELTENITDRVLAPANLFLLWLTFPLLKALHEFGHAFAIKRLGGEVHEMGIMLLVLTPIPYVDASSASAFRTKWERIMVSAAGMGVELFVAALALFLWIHMEPGTTRSLLYNVIFIAGVSSLFFNGNPLLRYDAYYILGDLLEIPNLGPRGLRYLGYLAQRHLFGLRDLELPVSTPGERAWFLVYSISSFVYRTFIYASIILFIASQFFVAGVVMAGWAVLSMIILPAGKGMRFLLSSPRLVRRRARAILVTSLVVGFVVVVISFVPVPLSTRAEGVIWIPEQCFVRARTEGFIDRLIAKSGSRVKKGDLLIECSDPLLQPQIRVLESQLRELSALYDTQVLSDRVQAEITQEEMKPVRAQLERSRERAAELRISSSADGTFLSPMAEDLPGRFVRRGELLGYVLDHSTITARVVVPQSEVDFVRKRTRGVKIRLPEKIAETFPAEISREVPASTDQLPSRILSQQGGGEIAIDPRDMLGTKAFQKVFLFDVELPKQVRLYHVGGRVYVRFDHGWEPLLWRWYRNVRQLFLRRFNV